MPCALFPVSQTCQTPPGHTQDQKSVLWHPSWRGGDGLQLLTGPENRRALIAAIEPQYGLNKMPFTTRPVSPDNVRAKRPCHHMV